MKKWILGCGVAVLAVSLAFAPMANAEEGDMTSKLQKMVGELSTDQQAALYLLLNQLSAKGDAAEGGEQVAKEDGPPTMEDVKSGVLGFVEAASAGDIDAMMNFISEDFEHYEYGDKAGLKDFLQQAMDMGYLEGLETNLEDTELEVDGETVILYPIEIEGVFGAATFEYVMKKEGDTWRLIDMDASGI